ncbi:MAG: hypothetical protein RDV48_29210, partial [Candidatus Eremiobacteraeota bacterium]|nr:hypothetical protein [Candidatus Eremiobacteraeota bacterium]
MIRIGRSLVACEGPLCIITLQGAPVAPGGSPPAVAEVRRIPWRSTWDKAGPTPGKGIDRLIAVICALLVLLQVMLAIAAAAPTAQIASAQDSPGTGHSSSFLFCLFTALR